MWEHIAWEAATSLLQLPRFLCPRACLPSKTYTFTDMNRIMSKDTYLGDPTTTDWVMDGQAVIYQDTALLTMARQHGGDSLGDFDILVVWECEGSIQDQQRTGCCYCFHSAFRCQGRD